MSQQRPGEVLADLLLGSDAVWAASARFLPARLRVRVKQVRARLELHGPQSSMVLRLVITLLALTGFIGAAMHGALIPSVVSGLAVLGSVAWFYKGHGCVVRLQHQREQIRDRLAGSDASWDGSPAPQEIDDLLGATRRFIEGGAPDGRAAADPTRVAHAVRRYGGDYRRPLQVAAAGALTLLAAGGVALGMPEGPAPALALSGGLILAMGVIQAARVAARRAELAALSEGETKARTTQDVVAKAALERARRQRGAPGGLTLRDEGPRRGTLSDAQ